MSSQLSGSEIYDESLYQSTGQQGTNVNQNPTTTTTDDSAAIQNVATILASYTANWSHKYSAGQVTLHIDVISIGTAAQQLYATSKPVVSMQIQNLSNTDTVTVNSLGVNLIVPGASAGIGALLNPAPASSQGGGTFNADNIDMASITVQTNLNNTQNIAVIYEV